MKLDPNCTFKTKNFMIKPHKSKDLGPKRIVLPVVQMDYRFFANFSEQVLDELRSSDKMSTETSVIRNSDELQQIMDPTRELVSNANQELKMREIHYDSQSYSLFSGMLSSITIFGIISTVLPFVFFRCNIFGCILRTIN